MNLVIAALLAISGTAFAQMGVRYDSNVRVSASNVPLGAQALDIAPPNATVTICSYPALGYPCTNTVAFYGDPALTQLINNPLTADAKGRCDFCIVAGIYAKTIQNVSGAVVETYPLSPNTPPRRETTGGIGCGTGDCITDVPAATQTVTQPSGTNFVANASGSGIFQTNTVQANSKGASPLRTGTSPSPNILAPITTTAISTSGSPSFVVSSADGLQVGMAISASFVPDSCILPIGAFTIPVIANISGTTITMSCPAKATNVSPVPITFGAVRIDPIAASIENSVATNWLLVGGATQGNTGLPGYQSPDNMNAQIFGRNNSLGLLVGAFSSQMTSSSGTRPLTVFTNMDTFNPSQTNKDSWVAYYQSSLMPGTTDRAQHIQIEQSVNNTWNPMSQDEDPFTYNIINNTVNTRLDCGTGQPFGTGNSPKKCSTAMDILQNGASFRNGIVIGKNALDTSSGRIAPALAMPVNVGLTWYISQGNNPGKVYGDSSGNIVINSNGLTVNRLGPGPGIQTAKTSSACAPTNTAFNLCTFGLSFPTAEPDISYGYACTINAVNAFLGSISSKTTTGLTMNIYATGTGTPRVEEASCIITHN
jgi:hypothetical protein